MLSQAPQPVLQSRSVADQMPEEKDQEIEKIELHIIPVDTMIYDRNGETDKKLSLEVEMDGKSVFEKESSEKYTLKNPGVGSHYLTLQSLGYFSGKHQINGPANIVLIAVK